MGGNSVRVWDTNDADRVLSQAQELGLTVMLGIWLTREKENFDYYNQEAVRALKERIRRDVLSYRNHPALLMWCIGNEMDLGTANVRAWRVIDDIAAMVHELDPNHPTTTAMNIIQPDKIRLLKNQCPNIDILSVNRYGGLSTLAEDIQKAGWEGPYIITEYGPPGYFEKWTVTEWDAPIEFTSAEKAQFIRSRYRSAIIGQSSHCLGGYAFYWGQKQECTPTWFSLFLETGEKTEVADMLQYLWSGRWPANRAPHLVSMRLTNKDNVTSNRLFPGETYSATVLVQDSEGDSLRYHWEVLPKSNWEELDGSVDREVKPTPVGNVLLRNNSATIELKFPVVPGPYRLFVYVYDGKGSVATANIPFYAESVSQTTGVQ
ncbi:glycoside hydrolase family 2 TIM barrel-domain containing protein [Nibrella saemangeumensis]|uniref:Glycoside hydrolase family 2 TIM barrel-domain containing protein n=2 Tax=Nibrella saemangeumensis TaxID=1084526 RepID=A0ABP8MJW4_9BACT